MVQHLYFKGKSIKFNSLRIYEFEIHLKFFRIPFKIRLDEIVVSNSQKNKMVENTNALSQNLNIFEILLRNIRRKN